MAGRDVKNNLGEASKAQRNSEEEEALLRWHTQDQKELSVGIEIECFIPNLGTLSHDRLVPVECPEDIFSLVAESLSQQLSSVKCGGTFRARKRRVSVDECDWGRLWTAKGDKSIMPRGENPFPVELVSQIMHFQEFDVTLFCDVMHALRSAPLRAATNESTGLHVHFGRAPDFFTVTEVAAIMKAYLRFESTINRLLLPISRQQNRFCRDLREVLAESIGLGQTASDSDLFSRIDSVVDNIRNLSPEERSCLLSGCQGTCIKEVANECLEQTQVEEGYMYRTKRAVQIEILGKQQLVPAGMVLHEVCCNGQSIWRSQSCASGSTPWDALSGLDDSDVIQCLFCVPDGVTSETLDLWMFRDSLILEKYGARYCKLNIMRIAKPSNQATLEFRQFPGSSFNQPLIIWGWVKFLALLVSHARATAAESNTGLPTKGTKEYLKRFLHLSKDTMMLAWYQDLQNRLEQPEEVLDSMRADWQWLWTHWSSLTCRTDARGFLTACNVWRQIYQAISGMRPIFEDTDCVWETMQEHQAQADEFMQRLYATLEQKLGAYLDQLRAAEECSRLASLSTVVRLVIDGGRLQLGYNEIRRLQAAIAETEKWDACPVDLACSIADLVNTASELMLDHACNLLALCERGIELDKEVVLQPPSCEYDASASLWVRRVYHELCTWILVPRAGQSKTQWKGLLARGWTQERVQALNAHMRVAKRSEALALAARWFAARRGVLHAGNSAAHDESFKNGNALRISDPIGVSTKERIKAIPML